MRGTLFGISFLAIVVLLSCGAPATSNDATEQDAKNEPVDYPQTFLNPNGTMVDVAEAAQSTKEITALANGVQKLTTESFIAKISDIYNPKGFQYKGTKPAVIDFYADWCGPCRMLAPILEELSVEYNGAVVFYKVNIDKEPDVARVLGISSIPTLLYCKPQSQPSKSVGALSKKELQQAIDDLLLN